MFAVKSILAENTELLIELSGTKFLNKVFKVFLFANLISDHISDLISDVNFDLISPEKIFCPSLKFRLVH